MAYRFINYRLPSKNPKPVLIQGFTRSLTNTWRQCAEGASNGDFFEFPSGDVDVNISANSATANQTLLIIGFNAAGNQIAEAKPLNQVDGRTEVQLDTQFFRIKLITLLASTQTTQPYMDENEKYVYIYERGTPVTDGVPDEYFGIMDLGKGISKQGYWYIPPKRYLAFVSGIINMDTSGASREIRLTIQYRNVNDNIWKTIVETVFTNGISNFPLDCTPTLYDENYGIDVRLSVQLLSGSVNNGGLVALHALEEDKYILHGPNDKDTEVPFP